MKERIQKLALHTADGLVPGRLVATFGNPYSSIDADGAPAISLGIVSAIGPLRDADGFKGVAIETDAAVNPGSFGGPLVDREGRVVGIVIEAASSTRWIGAAVPIDAAKAALEDLKAGRRPGPGKLGVIVDAEIVKDALGVVVRSVERGSPTVQPGGSAQNAL